MEGYCICILIMDWGLYYGTDKSIVILLAEEILGKIYMVLVSKMPVE